MYLRYTNIPLAGKAMPSENNGTLASSLERAPTIVWKQKKLRKINELGFLFPLSSPSHPALLHNAIHPGESCSHQWLDI